MRGKDGEHQRRFVAMVLAERARQDAKYGQPHPDRNFLAVLMEEVGEVASALKDPDDYDADHLRAELCQVAAVAAQWFEFLLAEEQSEDDMYRRIHAWNPAGCNCDCHVLESGYVYDPETGRRQYDFTDEELREGMYTCDCVFSNMMPERE